MRQSRSSTPESPACLVFSLDSLAFSFNSAKGMMFRVCLCKFSSSYRRTCCKKLWSLSRKSLSCLWSCNVKWKSVQIIEQNNWSKSWCQFMRRQENQSIRKKPWNYAAKLDNFMIAHSLFNEHYKVSNLTGIVAWSALGKRKLTSEKGLLSKANHCFSQFLTVGAVGELGRIEGCSQPVMISAGQPKGWNPCVLDGGSWLTLRWLLSSFNVSWRISIFSNDSPCGQTSWSPRWK